MCRAFRPWVDRNALNYPSVSVASGRRWVRTEAEVLRQSDRYAVTCQTLFFARQKFGRASRVILILRRIERRA